MPSSLRFALCNEVFENIPLADACRQIESFGYEGIEIAPFTLASEPASITPSDRQQYRRIIEEAGLTFVGLHWLMVSPAGLHLTTSDRVVRQKSWQHLRHLIDLCGDLTNPDSSDGTVMILGSPKQRSTVGGMSVADAVNVFTEEMAALAPHAEVRGVTILVEALPANQSNVINTLAEAVSIVSEVDSPAVQTMFDSHNAVDEREPVAALLEKYWAYIRHVHVNEIDGSEPGRGDYNFSLLLDVLSKLQYEGWVSVEAFDFSRGAEAVASGAIKHLRKAEAATAGRQ